MKRLIKKSNDISKILGQQELLLKIDKMMVDWDGDNDVILLYEIKRWANLLYAQLSTDFNEALDEMAKETR